MHSIIKKQGIKKECIDQKQAKKYSHDSTTKKLALYHLFSGRLKYKNLLTNKKEEVI